MVASGNSLFVQQGRSCLNRPEILQRIESTLRRWLRNLVPNGRLSFSQEGEDLVLARLLGGVSTGFYVDIGAHHPTRFSNTYYFYRRGWRGINVDATPGVKSLFRRVRPRDIFVEAGIGRVEAVRPFYIFNEPALNTFSSAEAKEKAKDIYKVVKTVEVRVKTLAQLFESTLPANTHIDFMSIDVEGLDLEVIASNDWSRYRPDIVVVELLNTFLQDVLSHSIARRLRDEGYRAIAKTLNSVFFVREGSDIFARFARPERQSFQIAR